MRRLLCGLMALLLLLGCGREVIAPTATVETASTAVPSSTPSPVENTPTPVPTQAPTEPPLPTFAPRTGEAAFAEELLSHDGEPLLSSVKALLSNGNLSKAAFSSAFSDIVGQAKALDDAFLHLQEQGRTLTADRRDKTAAALNELTSRDTLDDLSAAYARCPGEGEPLPISAYTAAVGSLVKHIKSSAERTEPFFSLDADGANDYKAALSRYIGEPVVPRKLLEALESLAQTEAYALGAALQADPEAARKQEKLSFGSAAEDMRFLHAFTETLCPLPDGARLPDLSIEQAGIDMDLFELAFYGYPGMAFLKAYGAHAPLEQQSRWDSAPEGYLAGIAIHAAYGIVPYLDDFGLEYVQYRWYEEMLDVTLTGISALLIHYYGYTPKTLAAYLESWGASSFTGYLYDRAMFDPFECLVSSYGYWCYLDICQAALDAGCGSEEQFLRDYLAAGPAPYEALKEYMVHMYQKQG